MRIYIIQVIQAADWKTEDAGISWVNISDGQFKTGSVGDIAVSETNTSIIYVGMGEHAIRGVMTTYGDGVYKSTDAGKSWMQDSKRQDTFQMSSSILQSRYSICGSSEALLHGASEDRGIYKTTDGQTWKKTLFVNRIQAHHR